MASKQTRLSDDASIYERREPQTDKQKWSELHGKEKLTYFKDYFLVRILVIIAVLAFVGYFLYTALAPKPESILSVAVADYSYYSDMFTDLQNSFSDYIDIDTEKQSITIDSSYYMSDSTSVQKISVYFFAGDLDVFIAPEDDFINYVHNGYLTELSEQLPNDLFSQLSNQFLQGEVIDTDVDGTELSRTETGVYGVYLDSLPCFQTYQVEGKRPVIGIVSTSNYMENAAEFIDYLFNVYQQN